MHVATRFMQGYLVKPVAVEICDSTLSCFRVALYARVSTLNGQDPEMQLRELREYAGRRGWSTRNTSTKAFPRQGVPGNCMIRVGRDYQHRTTVRIHRIDLCLCFEKIVERLENLFGRAYCTEGLCTLVGDVIVEDLAPELSTVQSQQSVFIVLFQEPGVCNRKPSQSCVRNLVLGRNIPGLTRELQIVEDPLDTLNLRGIF
jgi:hypothetical protein